MAGEITELIEKGREVPLPIGGATIEEINEYAARRIFRDERGCVRGVIFPFKEEGGQIHTGQGDVFMVVWLIRKVSLSGWNGRRRKKNTRRQR